MISKEFENRLRSKLREYYSPCEIRFYKDSVTVTNKWFPVHVGDVEEFVFDLDLSVDVLVEVVNQTRFKLRVAPEAYEELRKEIALNWLDDLTKNQSPVVEDDVPVVLFKTDNDKLEELLIEKLKQDVETFVTVNCVAALAILEQSKDSGKILMTEIEELMRFSFLNGLWSNASMKDLPPLQKLFNDRYNTLARTF